MVHKHCQYIIEEGVRYMKLTNAESGASITCEYDIFMVAESLILNLSVSFLGIL